MNTDRRSFSFSFQPTNREQHLLLHDSQIAIRGVPALFAQEGFEDWEAEESRDVFFASGGAEA